MFGPALASRPLWVISGRASARRDVRVASTRRHSQFAVARDSFPVSIKKSLFRSQGIRPKKSRVSMGLCQRGGALQLKFPVFSHGSGNSDSGDAFAVASQHSHYKSLIYSYFFVIAREAHSSQNPANFGPPKFYFETVETIFRRVLACTDTKISRAAFRGQHFRQQQQGHRAGTRA